ncbi:tetratricopeptide repeat-containing sulfotransferase family protein [Xanthomonas hortorum]|uniref:Tetratricopeptide repeat protein n=2 Tax=Xanthomonas hortorum pv. pelargonii TaxID=453602 RepID=A0AAW9ZQD4_9XANT|nr:sulfotransferase [Xanthomonas hortorum]MCE4354146.1 sulfotransferase [Xanthomonas hortorum pv. pelargonii]MCM5523657.1 sulfotransferase [Xanthomonas hortorum pv. pelargonii]MCM5534805.1 sulfotransferase [Xanthomonas hortorum pv. pelargonii]MCM5539686.1 sulfotransferase [Xanthomonas hortorum pv. pelargonii]MCM5543351.1 sulfotransferase [Xanthomonas hortorum pv. pelargonii]
MNMSLQQAAQLLQQGQLQQAIVAYQRVLQTQPRSADAWYNLGYLLRRTGNASGALDAYAQALLCGATSPEQIHLNRAALYSDHLHQEAAALRELDLALRCRPDYAPALLNLGNLHEELGARDQAITAYCRLVALVDTDAATHALQLQATARLLHLEPPTHAEDVRLLTLGQAVSAPNQDPELVASLLHALAHAYDRLGLHARAFDAASAGNRHAHAQARRYDPLRTQQHFDHIAKVFAAAGDATTPLPQVAEHDTVSPIFICGMFRSGSTLIEQALSRHPCIAAGGELDALPRLVAQSLSPFPQAAHALPAQTLAQLATRYRQRVAAAVPEQARLRYITDKRPDNFQLIGLIKQLFPAARIVHTRRHPLDNGLSIFMQQLNPHGFGYAGRLENIGHFYAHYQRLMEHWLSLYPDSIHTFDYDAFVAAPEPTLRALLDFLQLPWEPDCLDFHLAGGAVRTASYWQVRRPLHADASGRWRHYAAQLSPLRAALAQAGMTLAD